MSSGFRTPADRLLSSRFGRPRPDWSPGSTSTVTGWNRRRCRMRPWPEGYWPKSYVSACDSGERDRGLRRALRCPTNLPPPDDGRKDWVRWPPSASHPSHESRLRRYPTALAHKGIYIANDSAKTKSSRRPPGRADRFTRTGRVARPGARVRLARLSAGRLRARRGAVIRRSSLERLATAVTLRSSSVSVVPMSGGSSDDTVMFTPVDARRWTHLSGMHLDAEPAVVGRSTDERELLDRPRVLNPVNPIPTIGASASSINRNVSTRSPGPSLRIASTMIPNRAVAPPSDRPERNADQKSRAAIPPCTWLNAVTINSVYTTFCCTCRRAIAAAAVSTSSVVRTRSFTAINAARKSPRGR